MWYGVDTCVKFAVHVHYNIVCMLLLHFLSCYMPFEVWHWYFFYVPGISGNLGRGSPHSGPFQVRLFSVFNTALFAFRPVVLETAVTAVYVGLAVPIARRLCFRLHLLVMLVSILATCGKSVSKLYILCQIWLSLTSAFPNNTSYG